ncbi:MAG: VanW family protein [Limnochordia bacterium]|jgi:vancomycin resistance protein YoaR|nr:VanW family protein [Bacillota bacterium]
MGRGPRFVVVELEKTVTLLLTIVVASVAVTGVVDCVERWLFGVRPGVTLEGAPVGGLFAHEVRALIEGIAAAENIPAQDACIHKLTGQVMPEREGLEIDVDEGLYQVITAPRGKGIRLRRYMVKPSLTSAQLQLITIALGRYETGLIGSWQRTENIKLAVHELNNTLVRPGEEFSFNQVVGERTVERGYRPAPIFVGEAVVPGVGGGICQVSSTLYNVVLRSPKLVVTERVPHSRKVVYVPPGKDATVAWPHTDFKFRNDRSTPVVIRGAVAKGRVIIQIDGVPEE